MAILSLRNLNIYFRKGMTFGDSNLKSKVDKAMDVNVVNNVSFDIKESEIFGLVGESGCGKSITAFSIMGILPQNAYYEGDIYFEGKNLRNLSSDEMRKTRGSEISIIFQEPMTSLNPVFTVGCQVSEVLTVHEDISRKKAMEKTIELFSAVKIPSPHIRVKDYPHQMSGGMRQRVMIAMAIACNPSLLIADEPTTALDVTIQAQILSLLRNIKEEKNMSILLITHDLGVISENAQKVAVMYAGRIVEQTLTDELLNNPLHPYTIGLLNSLPKNRNTSLNPIPGFVPRPDNLPEGCKFSDRCAYVIDKCKEKEPDLISFHGDHLARCIRVKDIQSKEKQWK